MDPWFLSNVVIEILIGALAVFGNGLVITVLLRYRHLRSITNYFVLNLALSDFLLGLVGIPCVVLVLYGLPRHFEGCLLATSAIIIMAMASVFSLFSVTVERFVAIRHPFFYRRWFTPRLVLWLSLGNWAVALLVGLVPLMGWNMGWNDAQVCAFIFVIDMKYHIYMNFFAFILPTLLACVAVYCYILHVVLQHQRQDQQQQLVAAAPASGVNPSGPNDGSGSGTDEARRKEKSFKRDTRVAKKFAVIVGVFALCWLPLEVVNCLGTWFGIFCIPCVHIGVWLTHLNSALNPVLYAYTNSAIKEAMKNQMMCRSTKVEPNYQDVTVSTVQT